MLATQKSFSSQKWKSTMRGADVPLAALDRCSHLDSDEDEGDESGEVKREAPSSRRRLGAASTILTSWRGRNSKRSSGRLSGADDADDAEEAGRASEQQADDLEAGAAGDDAEEDGEEGSTVFLALASRGVRRPSAVDRCDGDRTELRASRASGTRLSA
jgi:hypothetical protein